MVAKQSLDTAEVVKDADKIATNDGTCELGDGSGSRHRRVRRGRFDRDVAASTDSSPSAYGRAGADSSPSAYGRAGADRNRQTRSDGRAHGPSRSRGRCHHRGAFLR